MARTEGALKCLLCHSPGEWPAAGLRAWLGLRAHSGSVDRRMSKDSAPVGDDVLFLLKSVLWLSVSLSSHSVCSQSS